MARSPESKAFLNAARDGDLETIRLSLRNGVGVDIKSSSKTTSLMRAAGNGHLEIVQLLLGNGADINMSNGGCETSLSRAAKNGHLEIVRYLLENGAETSVKGSEGTALWGAAENGHQEIVEILLANGAPVDVALKHFGYSSLCRAWLNGHNEIAERLLKAGADPSLALGPIVYKQRNDLLHRLIALGVNTNRVGEHGFTELMRAARGGSVEVVKTLIQQGADVHTRDKWGMTALSCACVHDDHEIAIYLMRCGAQPHLTNAISLGDLELVKRLIDEGADVNAAINEFFPLSAAVWEQRADIVELLLQNGAKVHVGSPSRRPMDLAVKNGGMTIIGLLLRALENE